MKNPFRRKYELYSEFWSNRHGRYIEISPEILNSCGWKTYFTFASDARNYVRYYNTVDGSGGWLFKFRRIKDA